MTCHLHTWRVHLWHFMLINWWSIPNLKTWILNALESEMFWAWVLHSRATLDVDCPMGRIFKCSQVRSTPDPKQFMNDIPKLLRILRNYKAAAESKTRALGARQPSVCCCNDMFTTVERKRWRKKPASVLNIFSLVLSLNNITIYTALTLN